MTLPHRQRRPLAWIALYAFLCGWTLPFYEAHPLGLDDDSACAVVADVDQFAATRLDAPQQGHGQPAHCMVCHLMRAMSGAMSSDVTTVAAPLSASAARGLTADIVPTAALAAPSSRGPPASL